MPKTSLNKINYKTRGNFNEYCAALTN